MIRAMTQQDTARVVELTIASGLFPPDAEGFLENMMASYFDSGQASGHTCLVDEEEDSLLGVVYYEPALATDRTWYLTMIGVRREVQGRGRGAALMQAVEENLQTSGQRVLLVETSGTPEFELTRRFYQKLGYEQEARVRDYYAAGDDMVLFRKVLNAA